ncbi:HAD superfamily phosphatase (TIGR01681 family)/FkbH-like protein [Tumebacillus sp. BK434]|uniref:HAD-IIIC family phosphatase n=1 Tax=Tumebacillus sp. BK434 TaxID=2512169 RepID=UPI00104F1893|nr:HAD-IIIC family phosphatase [Tumebacillus sp. BK434]TCP54508.1 HAD superfamily phosphatase (TIGR01681 family)/FkbH-like protein [Tumebacillus sp. BK434]
MEATQKTKKKDDKKTIKCVVWDLDNTVWDGVLLEDEHVILKGEVVDMIKELDARGILQSIASKNNHEDAMRKLEEFGIAEYFLYPQINWNSKASSIEQIAKLINIGIDTFAFVDDQPFEREEVAFSHPQVLCLDALSLDGMLELDVMIPRFITDDSKQRRQMYMADIARKKVEDDFVGPTDEFLASLDMSFTIAPATVEDLKRAEELTQRTNQLNTTGYTYNYDELDEFRKSDNHLLLIAGLNDKYGTYGKIGLALVETGEEIWKIKLLLLSCRVMSRGVGSILINHILQSAKEAGKRLQAEFLQTDRNRMMYITYKFADFKEVDKQGDLIVFENDLTRIQPFPEYVNVQIG